MEVGVEDLAGGGAELPQLGWEVVGDDGGGWAWGSFCLRRWLLRPGSGQALVVVLTSGPAPSTVACPCALLKVEPAGAENLKGEPVGVSLGEPRDDLRGRPLIGYSPGLAVQPLSW